MTPPNDAPMPDVIVIYRCLSCGGIYQEEPVSECDCTVGEKTEFQKMIGMVDRTPAAKAEVGEDRFNTPEYTLKGIDVVLRQGIASSNDEFKHQKLCEALDFLTRYKQSKSTPNDAKAEAQRALETFDCGFSHGDNAGTVVYRFGPDEIKEIRALLKWECGNG